MSEHVTKRGNRYYFRRRVPVELVALYGKPEHQQALRTSKRAEADKLARLAAVELDRIFDKLRAELNANDDTGNAVEAYDAVTGTWYTPRNEASTQEQTDAAELDMLASAAAFQEPLDAQIVNHDLQVARDARLAKRRQQRVDEIKEAIRGVLDGSDAHVLHALVAPSRLPAKATPTPIETKPVDRSLDTLVRMWEKARDPSSRSAATFHRTVTRFNEMVGRVAVPRITKTHVVQFKDAMEAAEVGVTAINASLDHMRTLCSYAMGQAWIDTNPATGVKLEVKRRSAKGLRPPFDVATLNRIFNNRVYTENYRPPQSVGEAGYWLPLLGLYTGARLEELCQLRPEDVHEDTYRDATGKEVSCWVLRITDSEHGQGIKNEYSRRRIPIHAELLKRGFVKYVQRHKGQRRIFPGMKLDNHGSESAVWSQWWIRLLRRECAPTSPKMVYHSFRHTFKDVCRECGITKELADALQGHSEGDAAGNYGAELYPLRPLVEAMALYQVHGLVLPSH